MGKLIDADELKDSLGCYPFMTGPMIRWFKHIINEQEEAEGKTGRWIPSKGEGFECSQCWGMSKRPTPYCPFCGSKNKVEEER